MEAAHQYFEVDVPRHLKTVELVPVVFAGEPNCGSEGAAMQLSGGGAATISIGSHGSLDEQRASPLSSSNGASGRDMFAPRLWCARKPPSVLFHSLAPFAIAASMYGCSSSVAPAASLLVATHTLGVGCAGQRADTARLLPLFLLPHATVVWHVQAYAQRLQRSFCDSLCRLVAAARITDAQLASAHPPHWEGGRVLLFVVHDCCDGSNGDADEAHDAHANDEEDDYGEAPRQHASTKDHRGGRSLRLTAQQLLAAMPADRAALLASAFGHIDVVVMPSPIIAGVHHHMPPKGGPHDEHRPLLQRVMQSCAANLQRTRRGNVGGGPATAAAATPLTTAAGKATTASAPPPATSGFGLPNALLLSRYFAEGAIRMPSSEVMQLPLFAPPSLLDPARSGGVAVRQLRCGFAVQDALSVLRHAITTLLSSDPHWMALLAPTPTPSPQPTLPISKRSENEVGDGSSGSPLAVAVVAGAASDLTAAAVPGGSSAISRQPNQAPSGVDAQAELRALCDAELQRIKGLYFSNGADVTPPAVVVSFLDAAASLVEELLRDAGRRAAEAQRAKLQQKLVEHLERVAPLLERVLQCGRFAA